MKCKHRKTWLIAGGYWEWCYQCGAIRKMRHLSDKMIAVAPDGKWTIPTGPDGHNPAVIEPRKAKGGDAMKN